MTKLSKIYSKKQNPEIRVGTWLTADRAKLRQITTSDGRFFSYDPAIGSSVIGSWDSSKSVIEFYTNVRILSSSEAGRVLQGESPDGMGVPYPYAPTELKAGDFVKSPDGRLCVVVDGGCNKFGIVGFDGKGIHTSGCSLFDLCENYGEWVLLTAEEAKAQFNQLVDSRNKEGAA